MTTLNPCLPTLVLLSDWHDCACDGWQLVWPLSHSDQARWIKVEQDDWQWPRRGDWMMQLDEALLADTSLQDRPAVLVAQGLGCHLVAAWATHSRHVGRVAGAWLVAPPDLDAPERLESLPPQLHGWVKVPRLPLPFPAQVLAPTDAPDSSLARARELAAHWRADFVTLDEPAAAVKGPWPEGWPRLQGWLAERPQT
ncbi:RBBP9/YdeN family alpha/beta hydrolase [Aquabacterium sp.]|uniref:RBBP9/YdeN family alpha/beta hydrolase n=1 Tax=Aquabacterium sp. TaxID=1872578 RepID=UPI002E32F558|nr:alpha/beta hydrolase [Aquabacterium sp.]HEX5311151.1 alpha/beta hydrolase [Aquabacterium sp.]